MNQSEKDARIAIATAEQVNTPAARQLGERIAHMIRHHAPKAVAVGDDGETHIALSSILSARTKQGLVEMTINGESVQMDVAKAREVSLMLHQAIEAAITDTLIHQFFVDKIGFDEEKAARVLMDFRELRQGSKSIVYPS
jgi:hypothetical protein